MKLKICISIILAILSVSSARASFILDFNVLEHIDNELALHGSTYSEDGFLFTTNGIALSGTTDGGLATIGANSIFYSGSTALAVNTVGATIELTKIGGGAFTPTRIDLSEYIVPESAPVTFVRDGGHTQTFNTDGNLFIPETFTFDMGFMNTTQLTWTQVSPYHQFDNIHVVPEPSTVAIFALGMMGLRLRRLKKS